MTNLSYIDTSKSIETGRLIYKRDWLDTIDRIVFSMFCIAMVTYPSLLFFEIDIDNTNDKAVAFTILPLVILFGLYGLYRKLTETRLIFIETLFTQHRNKKLLIDFLKLKGYDIFRDSKEVIIATNEESLSFNKLWTKTFTFIISERKIYFTIVKNYPKVSPPVLFTHLFLKADLKKFFNDKT